jgi:hypothetical protein
MLLIPEFLFRAELPLSYNLTIESGTFESTLPDLLEGIFSRPGIHAYFCDGYGLNYCLADDSLDPHLVGLSEVEWNSRGRRRVRARFPNFEI